MSRRIFAIVALAACCSFLSASGLAAQCTGANHVTWPTAAPVWDFCWQRLNASSLANGEGIRISAVKYKGVTVLKDGHIPVLNVQYNPGGCGVGANCYRDWFDQEQAFACAPSPSTGYCTGTTTAPATVCNHPGSDAGSFSGVSVQDLGTSVKLISQAAAGWYRYISTWEFFPDGSFRPGMDITSVNNSCVAHTHRHHAYFRLDFDLAGPANDFANFVNAAGSRSIVTEEKVTDTMATRAHWRLGSTGSRARVHVQRTLEDGFAGGDTFARGDGWLFAYDANQLDDGPHSLSQCPADLDNYLNSQNVKEADLVLWVHSGTEHEGEPGGVSAHCMMFGPQVRVSFGTPAADFDGNAASDLKIYRNGTWVSFVAP